MPAPDRMLAILRRAAEFATRTPGRTGHFVQLQDCAEVLAAGEDVDPISIDCECDRWSIYPVPVLLDGYHRLAGALLSGTETLLAVYGGRVDLLNYLTGKRRNRPHE